MNCYRLPALLIAAAMLMAASPLPPEVLLLAHAREKVRATLAALPSYACLENVDRYTRQSASKGLRRMDTLRFEVIKSPSGELYSWPDKESTFGEPVLEPGLTSSGEFFVTLENIFLGSSSVHYRGSETLNGVEAVRYDYRVPQLISKYTLAVDGQRAVVGSSGSVWIDRDNAEVLRITERADDIPPGLALRSVSSVLDYGRVILGKNSIQLPEQALVAIAYLSGKERLNAIGFTHCREYQAQSDFSAPPRTSRPIPTPPRAQEFQIPPGLNFTLRLAAPIDLKRVRIGDEIAAVTGSPVKSKGKLIVPVGAHAAGRVRVLTPLDEQPNVLSVGFEFTEITFRDATGTAHHASFYARLSGLDPLPDVSMNMQRSQSLTSPHQFTQMFTTRTESVSVTPAYLPGVGSFLVENSLSQLPKGFGMRWITTSLASAR